jgi:hypothetical protein
MNAQITNGKSSINFLIDDIQIKTQQIKDQLKQLEKQLEGIKPVNYKNRLSKFEIREKNLDLLSRKIDLALELLKLNRIND